MIDARLYSRPFLTDFILLYKSFPCLWKKKSVDYNNKVMKSVCYKKMIEKLKEVEPNATREMVVKKINSIRVSRRKEWVKVQKSIQSGSEVYKPHLWYYDLLNFVEESDEAEEYSSGDPVLDDPIGLPKLQVQSVKSEQVTEINGLFSEDDTSENNSRTSQFAVEYLDDCDYPGTSKAFTPIHERPRPPKRKVQSSYESEGYHSDRFDIFGRNVAMKMRDLTTQQRVIAEKIINDTLFKAEMGILRLSDAMDNPLPSK